MKLHLRVPQDAEPLLEEVLNTYRDACNYVSEYVFHHDCTVATLKVNKATYHNLRERYGLKAQFATSVPQTVIARYR